MQKIIKYKEPILVFTLSFFFSASLIIESFNSYLNIRFDSQEFLTWNYLSHIGKFPYKDFYYPYGILYYLKDHFVFIYLIYFFLFTAIFMLVFFFLKALWKTTFFIYLIFILFGIFTITHIDLQTFSRYGILLGVDLGYVFLFTQYKKISTVTTIIIGLFNGLLFSLIYDQGIYTVSLFLCLLVIKTFFLSNTKERYSYRKIFKKILFFFLGIAIGFLPFLVFLITTGSISGFFLTITSLSDIAKYGKTPFFPSFWSIDNLITNLAILITVGIISYRIYLKRVISSFSFYSLFVLLVTLLVLEQKNVIRSIDTQLILFSYLLFLILFCELYNYFKKINNSQVQIVVLSIFFFLIAFLFCGNLQEMTIIPQVNSLLIHQKESYLNKKLSSIQKTRFEYLKVVNTLKSFPDFTGKVYSFPGDPLFYVLLDQRPPYYSTIYEASPLYAQNTLIQQIKNQQISYVVYNVKNFAIQDTVPNYIRGATLHAYILTHFSIEKRVAEFLILKQNTEHKDFFSSKELNALPDFKKSLLDVDLESIPESEGYYKNKYLSKYKEVVSGKSIKEFNAYLANHRVDSTNKFLVLNFASKNNYKRDVELSVKTQDGYETAMYFKACDTRNSCIINLSHLPLFYQSRLIKEIKINKSIITHIVLFAIPNNTIFW